MSDATAASIATKAAEPFAANAAGRTLVLVAAAALAIEVVARMRPVWSEVPDHAFGWFVPLAVAYLVWERWNDRPATTPSPISPVVAWSVLAPAVAMLAVLRLLLEPWPLWPAPLWLFTGIAVGLALGGIALAAGGARARHFAFPIAFVALALPWPSAIDTAVVLPLRESLAAIAAEVIGVLGYPAVARGAVIEVGRGMVGVDEACSGIRSLQASTLAALFLGELLRFRWIRRLALLGVGLALALTTNLVRTVLLAWKTAADGTAAATAWHDPIGYTLLAVCLGGLALAAWLWRRQAVAPSRSGMAPGRSATTPSWSGLAPFAGALLVALGGIELGTWQWFASGDRAADRVPRWTATLRSQRDFETDAFTPAMQDMLRCDAHELGRWTGARGERLAGYVLEWRRGQAARYTARAHTPTVCLPLAGSRLVAARGTVSARIGELDLPFDAYVFASERETLHVYHLAWDVRAGRPLELAEDSTTWHRWFARRWREVAEARRSTEARVLTLALYGASDDATADSAFREELARMILPATPTFANTASRR